MQRRQFLLSGSVLGLNLAMPGLAQAQARHRAIEPIDIAADADLVEFFWYRCPHCNRFEPLLREWLSAHPNVSFQRIPAIIRPSWAAEARIFYAAQVLGRLDELHQKVFAAIHEQGLPLEDEQAWLDWLAGQGLMRAEFEAALGSEQVHSAVAAAARATSMTPVIGVPTLLIKNQQLTDSELAGSQEAMLEVTAELLRG